jgi:iron complex transport system substrate-binding protein
MRVCSLVPGATEVVALLGLSHTLVGISHECDYPDTIRHVPVVVKPTVDYAGMDSVAIDRQIRALASSDQKLYELNQQALIDARPEVILAQDICHVCAVTAQQLEQAISTLPSRPQVLALDPQSLQAVIHDVERIGQILGEQARGHVLAESLSRRLRTVREQRRNLPRPRVLCLEWLNPLYVGGHWVPEMVEFAGGQDVLGCSGQPSRRVSWQEIRAADPQIVVLMPCGFSIERTSAELRHLCRTDPEWSQQLHEWPSTYIVDASSYFSRPGPRLADGVELLGDIFSGAVSAGCNSPMVRDVSGSLAL